MVLLDPVYHIIHLGHYLVQALSLGVELGQFPLRVGQATEPHSVTLVIARAAGQSVVASFHPVTGQLQASMSGRRVDDPLNLLRDRLLVVSCQGMPQTAGLSVAGVLV
jgi:hypothetical protein